MELKPDYKITEGETQLTGFSEPWKAIQVNELGQYKSGSVFPIYCQLSSYYTNTMPFFKVSDLNNDIKYLIKSKNYITIENAKRIHASIVPAKSIIFAKIGAAIFLERKRILNQDSYIDNNMCAFICNNNINYEFMYYQFMNISLSNLVSTTALPSLGTKELNSIIFLMPPSLAEQQAIAAALSDVDALLSSLSDLIAKKRNIKKAAMQELLTGKTRLPGFSGEWHTFELGKCGSIQKESITPSSYPRHIFYEYSMPAFDEGKKPVKVYGEKIYSNKIKIKGQLILFNKLNVRQKRVWIVNINENNAICSTEFLPYQTKEIVLDLLEQILLTDETTSYFESCSTGTSNSQKRITPSIFLKYKCYLPPTLAEQQAIASVLSDMDAEIAALEARQEKIKHIKQGMMQNLLTGKIRLRAFCL